jgi:hypothetical protein
MAPSWRPVGISCTETAKIVIQSPNTYACAKCKQTFEKGWSDEEALAEAAELFEETVGEHPAIVCDVCFREIISSMPIRRWVKD